MIATAAIQAMKGVGAALLISPVMGVVFCLLGQLLPHQGASSLPEIHSIAGAGAIAVGAFWVGLMLLLGAGFPLLFVLTLVKLNRPFIAALAGGALGVAIPAYGGETPILVLSLFGITGTVSGAVAGAVSRSNPALQGTRDEAARP